ncbi:hypothetical protein [Mucilaginibacter paludis]|uniref:Uncharacterized protein n=1 Tax=Mucilaginibacter paludis DSM 18603 TaxID=714943 RepID=H1YER7_9SPHI|nr:hypothetical protein [Mucilaginibacter paludis]EHQ24334.1 hypothetical protein Mucpa_0133 [Mucilaginibacter paludis DSM 18603]
MDILNWIDKKYTDIENDKLYKEYFSSISLEEGIDVLFLLNLSMGIDIILNKNYHVKGIHFYSGSQKGGSRFEGNLPFNLDFSFSQQDTRSLLGMPNSSGGGDFSFLYGVVPDWDKYLFDSYSLNLQFSKDKLTIDLITVDSLFG